MPLGTNKVRYGKFERCFIVAETAFGTMPDLAQAGTDAFEAISVEFSPGPGAGSPERRNTQLKNDSRSYIDRHDGNVGSFDWTIRCLVRPHETADTGPDIGVAFTAGGLTGAANAGAADEYNWTPTKRPTTSCAIFKGGDEGFEVAYGAIVKKIRFTAGENEEPIIEISGSAAYYGFYGTATVATAPADEVGTTLTFTLTAGQDLSFVLGGAAANETIPDNLYLVLDDGTNNEVVGPVASIVRSTGVVTIEADGRGAKGTAAFDWNAGTCNCWGWTPTTVSYSGIPVPPHQVAISLDAGSTDVASVASLSVDVETGLDFLPHHKGSRYIPGISLDGRVKISGEMTILFDTVADTYKGWAAQKDSADILIVFGDDATVGEEYACFDIPYAELVDWASNLDEDGKVYSSIAFTGYGSSGQDEFTLGWRAPV